MTGSSDRKFTLRLVDVPEGGRLDMMNAYSGMTKKSFVERMRRFRIEQTPLNDLQDLVVKLTQDQVQS